MGKDSKKISVKKIVGIIAAVGSVVWGGVNTNNKVTDLGDKFGKITVSMEGVIGSTEKNAASCRATAKIAEANSAKYLSLQEQFQKQSKEQAEKHYRSQSEIAEMRVHVQNINKNIERLLDSMDALRKGK